MQIFLRSCILIDCFRLLLQRPLSPTPAPNYDCRQVKIVRLADGTYQEQYVECGGNNNGGAAAASTAASNRQQQPVESRFGQTTDGGLVKKPDDVPGKPGKHFLVAFVALCMNYKMSIAKNL